MENPSDGSSTVTNPAAPAIDLAAHKTSADHDGRYAQTFTDLNDVPAAYTGAGGKVVAVKADASGLEFITAPSGGGSAGTFDFGLITEAAGSSTSQDWGSLV